MPSVVGLSDGRRGGKGKKNESTNLGRVVIAVESNPEKLPSSPPNTTRGHCHGKQTPGGRRGTKGNRQTSLGNGKNVQKSDSMRRGLQNASAV